MALPASALAIAKTSRPKRPGRVSVGRVLQVRANHFKVLCNLPEAQHYDVEIEIEARDGATGGPEQSSSGIAGRIAAKPLPTVVCRSVLKAVAKQQQWSPGWAYDGRKSLHSPGMFLRQGDNEFKVEADDQGRMRPFKVIIKWVNSVDISALMQFIAKRLGQFPQDAVQALDVALMHALNYAPGCTPFGRAFFFEGPGNSKPLGSGAEVWLGHSQSLRACETGLTLNVDVASTAFIQAQPAVDFVARAAGMRPDLLANGLTGNQLRTATKAANNIQIEVTHIKGSKRKYKIRGFTEQGANRSMFDCDGQQKSVSAYFEEKYKMKLRMPGAPCINVGSRTRQNWLPMEVCNICPGQRVKKLDTMQAQQMPKLAGTPPDARQNMISKAVNDLAKLGTDPTVNKWGIKVDSKMIEIEGRMLTSPDLQYKEKTPKVNTGTTGSWNLRTVSFNKPVIIPSWAVASFTDPQRTDAELRDMIANQCNILATCGVNIPKGQLPPIVYHDSQNFVSETIEDAMAAGSKLFKIKPTLVMVCLPTTGTELYREVKRAADSILGVVTQCFVATKCGVGAPQKGRRDQYCANVAMKINAKLGGINVRLAGSSAEAFPPPISGNPVMFMGADVTHPTGFLDTEPSIASVVASMDPATALYCAKTMIQGHRVEIIPGMRQATRQLLHMFYTKNKRLPHAIIMYRDGVSEGQFDEVQQKEIPQIIAACEDIKPGGGYRPKLTFLVVQKRHHTRLFPLTAQQGDKSGNIMPGTVVDKNIVHPFEFSWFLNSHAGLQGTNRPAHYHVLVDENKFTADNLINLTYKLCFLFCRCTRSVSIVSPAYYAHLAAERGRLMCLHTDDSDVASQSSGGAKAPVQLMSVHANLATSMYYV